MAKKSSSRSRKKRKQRKPNVPVYRVPTEDAEASASEVAVAPQPSAVAKTSSPAAAPQATIDWAQEYPYFMPDMKRLGIVVLLMVVLLLAMNFVFIYLL